jgi:hypothetical protein
MPLTTNASGERVARALRIAAGERREARRMRIRMLDPTKTDPNGDWEIVDNVTCLRPWGGDGEIELPDQPFAEAVIGSDPTCAMVLDDETHRLSRMHARLVRHGALWTIHDLASKNGTWIDGKRRAASAITPGTEIRLGGVVLVAESQALIALRDLLRRWLGWDDERRADVDRALRAVREAFAERVPLFLCGDGDLGSIAARLHRQTLGSRPFVVQTKADDLQSSFARASRGTLCIEVTGKPLALASAIATARTRSDSVRLTLCAPTFDSVAPLALALGRTARIDLPRIADRRHEVQDIVREYVREYAFDAALVQTPALVDEEDIRVLGRHAYDALGEIEDDARRLVVLRALGIRAGAKALNISHSAFSRWASRRGLPALR